MTSPLCIPTLSKSILVLSLFRFISIHNCSTSSSGVVQNSSNTFHPFLVVSKIYSFPGSTCLLIKAPHSNDWQNLGATSTGKTSNSSLDRRDEPSDIPRRRVPPSDFARRLKPFQHSQGTSEELQGQILYNCSLSVQAKSMKAISCTEYWEKCLLREANTRLV